MTDHYQSSSSNSSLQDQRKQSHICFNINRPIPEQWTEVNEYYMEKRDTYQQWTSGMNYQLKSLRQQLLAQGKNITELDRQIEEEKARRLERMLASSSHPPLHFSDSASWQSYRPSTAAISTRNRATGN